jgi:SAM-dependent methyltransferase
MKGPKSPVVYATYPWPTNGHLIADVARLGYVKKTDYVLDPTYGRGVWWSIWQPKHMAANVWKVGSWERSEMWHGEEPYFDFRNMPFEDGIFDVVAYDPPYKLNGTPTPAVDAPYGVDEPTRWRERLVLIAQGQDECARVLKPGGILLLKCQDQVCSGKVVWQTDACTEYGKLLGLEKIDRFDMIGGRAQPKRTRKDGEPSVQVHARHNSSTLLVFRKGKA